MDEPARLAFIAAHEVAHIVNHDCAPEQPVVDEQEEIVDGDEIEVRADNYAANVLVGTSNIPQLTASGFKALATEAVRIEKESGTDASAVVWTWARRSGDYVTATLAAQALYRTRGGQRIINEYLEKHLDFENAPETDRALLRCLSGDREQHAATG